MSRYDLLEKGMATHSSSVAGQSHGQRSRIWLSIFIFTFPVSHFTFHFQALENEMATHSSVLAWWNQGWGSLVGCCLWGRTESDMTKVTWQQQQQQIWFNLNFKNLSFLICKSTVFIKFWKLVFRICLILFYFSYSNHSFLYFRKFIDTNIQLHYVVPQFP